MSYNPREYKKYLKNLSDTKLLKEWDEVMNKYFKRKEKGGNKKWHLK